MRNEDVLVSKKQGEFIKAFKNPKYTEILYGGAAGGGKSYILWLLQIINCYQHPGIRIGLARNTLADIKRNTLTTFYEVVNNLKIPHTEYSYNPIDGKIKWANGSVIQFFELRYLPSDPNYDRFGGALLTFGCIEEAAGVDLKGKNIFKSRLGRWKNEEYGINGKLLMTCNPGINFLYTDFYLPWQNNELEPFRYYIPANLRDNKYLGEEYRRNLESLDHASRARLLDGEWDFDGDKSRLLKYEEVLQIYEVGDSRPQSENYYLSADIAFSSDKCVLILWSGLHIIKIFNYEGDEPEKELIRIRDIYNVPPRNIVYDSDGVGQYLKGKLRQAIPFVNNGQPLLGENYDNLKSQVYFKLAEKIKDGEVKCFDNTLKEELIQEVYEIKSQPLETIDGKMKLVKKKEVKASIGRSPDVSDAMAYRMYFEIKKRFKKPF